VSNLYISYYYLSGRHFIQAIFICLPSISREDDKVKKYPIEQSVVWKREFFIQNSVITNVPI